MDNKQKSALAIAIAAGVSGMTVADDASAATYSATLTSMLTYSNNGTAGSPLNINSSTGLTWSYDDVTNLMTQTGGTINARSTTAPTTTLFRQFITGLVIGNGGAASAASFSCVEGNFGANVGASICGNYLLGGNFANESTTTWGPGTAASRTLGGDDVAAGAQQTIAALNGMSTISWVGTTLILSNGTCYRVPLPHDWWRCQQQRLYLHLHCGSAGCGAGTGRCLAVRLGSGSPRRCSSPAEGLS